MFTTAQDPQLSRREKLHSLLAEALGTDDVYFQPVSNIEMTYPAIVYLLDDRPVQHAGNRPYKLDTRYQVTVISDDPDSEPAQRVAQLPGCAFNRRFVADDLYQDVFTINF